MPPKGPPLYCKLYKAANEARIISDYVATKNNFDEKLSGFCASGAIILHKVLKRYGINSVICCKFIPDNGAHAYVKTHDYILDCTASQFIKLRILIAQEKEQNELLSDGGNKWWENPDKTCVSPYDFMAYLHKIKWEAYQMPKNVNINKFYNATNKIT